MAIPKIIHYCWFGSKPIPEMERRCIASWKKYLPEYEIRLWNEQTVDIKAHPFTKQAYEAQHYTFVSDFVRAIVLYEQGGIYLDTDVEILKDISNLFEDTTAVLGFENKTYVGTAMMAFMPKHPIMGDFYNYYKREHFIDSRGNIKITANPEILAGVLRRYNIDLNGQMQDLNGIRVYNREKFFPKKISEKEFIVTDETVAIHHFTGSWLTERQRKRGENKFWIEVCRPLLRRCRSGCILFFGEKNARNFENKIRNLLR